MKKKTIITTIILSSVSTYALSLSHGEIQNMVERIKKERSGIKLDRLSTTPNPFAINKQSEEIVHKVEVQEEIVQETVYELTSIFNRAAFINGKWYKRGDSLDSYTISKVGTKSVTLVNGNNEKVLALPKKKSIIMFKGK